MDKVKNYFSHKRPARPVNHTFRDSNQPLQGRDSSPGRFANSNSGETQWFEVDPQQEEYRKSATYPPEFTTPEWPDLEPALRESRRAEYLGSELPPPDSQKMDSGSMDLRQPEPSERRLGKSKPTDSRRTDEVDDLRRQIRKMESEHQKILKVKEERHVREERQLKDDYKASMQGLSEELKTVKKDAKEQAAEIRQLRQDLQTLKSNADQERRRMEQDHTNKLSTLTRDLQTARDDASQKERRMAQEHADTVRSLNQEIQRVRNAAEMKEGRVAQEHAKVINDLNHAHAIKVSTQEQEHQQSRRHLQLEIEELNEAWLNRDDEIYQSMLFTTSGLPRKPDDKIKNQVLELQQMVDDLSRTDWKQSPEMWTDRVLQRIGNQQHGQRSLKKAIIQDLIWSLLFQRIFCSPFRMFGEEGMKLECEWNEQCGKEKSSGDQLYTWPPPGVKAERWRYMTIKECREILSTPIPSHVDKRAEVKRGFKTSQDKLLTALEDELERIVQLTEQESQIVEKLVKKAAVTWLDFAMHRCRIVIHPTGTATKSTAEKVSMIQKGSVALTVLPIVGRYGNVKGVDLDRFTTIKGYEGSKLDIT